MNRNTEAIVIAVAMVSVMTATALLRKKRHDAHLDALLLKETSRDRWMVLAEGVEADLRYRWGTQAVITRDGYRIKIVATNRPGWTDYISEINIGDLMPK